MRKWLVKKAWALEERIWKLYARFLLRNGWDR